jgi:acyl-CoA thioesterase-1
MRQRKFKAWWIFIIILLVVGLYLNRSYAYFFDYLGNHEIIPNTPISDAHAYFYLPLDSQNTGNDKTYLALGDSLTRGVGVEDDKQTYAFLLADNLSQHGRIEYTDLAVPGSTSADMLKNQIPFLGDGQYQYLSLMVGMNDILTQVSSEQFQNNYQQILDQMSLRTPNIIVINIPFLSSSRIILPPYNYLVDWRTQQFNSIIETLVNQKKAQGVKINYVDLYSLAKTQFRNDPSLFSPDGFHPSAKGYKLWSELINANLNF